MLRNVIIRNILILMVNCCTLNQLGPKLTNEFVRGKKNYKMYCCNDDHDFTNHIITK